MLEVSLSEKMFSASKNTPIGGLRSDSMRTMPRKSTTFRAKRDTLFVMMRSILPTLHSAIMRLNSSRCFVDVPLMPSSA